MVTENVKISPCPLDRRHQLWLLSSHNNKAVGDEIYRGRHGSPNMLSFSSQE